MIRIIAPILLIVFLAGCSYESIYYQLYKTQPTLKTEVENFNFEELVYADDFCEIRYNFWSEGGDAGFVFTNVTDSILCLQLDRSYFVLNGVAYDYYLNRTFSSSKSVGLGVYGSYGASKGITGITNSGYLGHLGVSRNVAAGSIVNTSESETIVEQAEVCVPAKTSKIIKQYSVYERPLRYCNLTKFPSKNESDKVSFGEEDSPIRFGNVVTYCVDGDSEVRTIAHDFYVSEMANYPESGFVKEKQVVNCDPSDKKRSSYKIEYTPFYSSTSFYNRYNTTNPRFDSTRVPVFKAVR